MSSPRYLPTLASVKQHPLPAWYQDAKFGIFVHWTISSVPAYAPTGLGDISQIFAKESQAVAYTYTPYAEWYQNSLRIKGSPVQEYHRKTYGTDYPYENFAPIFDEQCKQWDPDEWTSVFAQAGARYVVLVTKHHDGFLLWDSQYPNPRMPAYHTTRDVVGELTTSVTSKGMKMGLYYSSALDWTFSSQPTLGLADLLSTGPTSQVYRQYVENHWKELIDRYDPAILWSDIAYPPDGDLFELFAYFYNRNPEGVVNDRWFQLPKHYASPLGKIPLRFFVKRVLSIEGAALPPVPHCDYRTAEYANLQSLPPYKWESVRGIGNSFTYNQFEQPADYLKAADLIRMLVDIVSKNGNLLLNVGPRPDGSIPEPQIEALQGIGSWLAVNGEAIYGTRPWLRTGDEMEDGLVVRYTAKEGFLYITILKPPQGTLRLPDLPVKDGSALSVLGKDQLVDWHRDAGVIRILSPVVLDWEKIPVLRMEID
jgi:alpha-L-fucosidase